MFTLSKRDKIGLVVVGVLTFALVLLKSGVLPIG